MAEPESIVQLEDLGFPTERLAENGGGLCDAGTARQDLAMLFRLRTGPSADEGVAVLEVSQLSLGCGCTCDRSSLAAWHHQVRSFLSSKTSSAQVEQIILTVEDRHRGDKQTQRASDVGYIVVRNASTYGAVAKALERASKGSLKLRRLTKFD